MSAITLPDGYPQVDHEWAGREDGHNCATCIAAEDHDHKCDRPAHVTADLRRVEYDTSQRAATENLRRHGGIAGAGFHPPAPVPPTDGEDR